MLGTDQASNKSHEICDSACFDGALKADFGEAVSNSIQGSPTKMPSVTDHTLTSTENISNVNGREMGGTALSPKTDIMTCKVFEGIQANFGPSRTTSEVLDDTNLLMDISRIRQGGVEMGEKNHGEPVCITEALSKSALTAAPSKLLAAPTTGEKSSVLMVRNPAADTFLGHPRDIE